MLKTNIDWSRYIRISGDGHFIQIRNGRSAGWDDAHEWPLDEAEELAEYLKNKATEARRNSPAVKEIASDIRDSGEWTDDPDNLAYFLYRNGYRKAG